MKSRVTVLALFICAVALTACTGGCGSGTKDKKDSGKKDSAKKDSAKKDSAKKDSAKKDSAKKDSAKKDSAKKDSAKTTPKETPKATPQKEPGKVSVFDWVEPGSLELLAGEQFVVAEQRRGILKRILRRALSLGRRNRTARTVRRAPSGSTGSAPTKKAAPKKAAPKKAAPKKAAPKKAAPKKAAAKKAAPANAATRKPTPAPTAIGANKDWAMWAGSIGRNMVNPTTGINLDFKPPTEDRGGKNILWTAKLGSQTYGNPIVSDGKVLVGTNNGAEYRPKHKGDRGIVLCFDAKSGKFLWQLTRTKLAAGRVNDWPEQGICSTACIEKGRAWVITNRAELVCVDMEGFHDGENDGPYKKETDADKEDADIIWSLDLIEDLGVFPHNLATSSPVVYGDMVYLLTSNGVDEAHLEIPSPRSPSFLAVNKNTGEVVWEDNSPFDKILHGQWSSPAIGVVNGKAQVYMPGGDGWLYALDAKTGKHIWKFDLNPKDSKWELGGRGTRNAIIATPVFIENSVLLAVGQDPEHGEGTGHLYRIDATKKGDVSPVTPDNKPNLNSAQIWHYGGVDTDGKITGEKEADIFRRTMSTVAVKDGIVYAADLSGRLHAVDFKTGKRYWEADVLAAIWGSPLYVDGRVLLGDEDGILSVFKAGKELKKEKTIEFASSIYSTPTLAGGILYVSDRSRLYAISVGGK